MCFSATVSYSSSAILIASGIYAALQVRPSVKPYWPLALVPFFFGIQQGMEGRVWQALDAGMEAAAVPYALAFHFFSHFLWLWWIPLSSVVLEYGIYRRRVFLGLGVFGALSGGLVFFSLLFNSEWLQISIRETSIVYDINAPVRGFFSIPVPASALYALIILVPLLFSSYRHIRIFGVFVILSIIIASISFGYAFVSVWCFFAALLSLYLVYVIRVMVSNEREAIRNNAARVLTP